VQVVNTQQHARADSWSEDKPGAWFSVSLPPDTPIEPTHYSVRHGYGGGAQMRNWKLLASFDGMAWALARNHVNDESLKGGYAVHTWSLPVRILYLCLLLYLPLLLDLSPSIHFYPSILLSNTKHALPKTSYKAVSRSEALTLVPKTAATYRSDALFQDRGHGRQRHWGQATRMLRLRSLRQDCVASQRGNLEPLPLAVCRGRCIRHVIPTGGRLLLLVLQAPTLQRSLLLCAATYLMCSACCTECTSGRGSGYRC
jgi:hypothetical protein